MKMNENELYKLGVIKLIKESSSLCVCDFCKNKIECKEKDCPSYSSGRGGMLDNKKVDFPWSCLDFDFGTCGAMEFTKCNGCWKDNFANFELDLSYFEEYVKETNNG